MSLKSKILIVDDNPTNVAIMEEILEEHELESVLSGEEALDIVADFKPDLILLDIMMPGINGYEVCEILRRDSVVGKCKIIMVSAKAMVSERLKGYEVGADDYITKPFEEDELVAKVQVYLRLKRVEDLDILKTDFLRLLCLNTVSPLSSIISPLKAIIDHRDMPNHEKQNKIEMGYGNAVNLQRLFEKVVLLSSIKSGSFTFDLRPQNLCDIIREAIIEIQDKAIEQNISIREVLPACAKSMVDRKRFKMILLSLLDNAVRFSPMDGRVIVEVSHVDGQYFLTIIDQGKGMNQDTLESLFQEFTYMELDRTNAQWRGLSLVLAQQVISGHHGTMEIESEKGSGTIITIGIPKASDEENEADFTTETTILLNEPEPSLS